MKKSVKIILVAAIAAIAAIIVLDVARKVNRRNNVSEIVSMVVANKEKIARLVTYRYSRDTLLFVTAAPSVLKSYFTSAPDTVAVYLARPTVCAGVDLGKLTEDDFSFRGDTLFVTLPQPEILDLYINHSDLSQVYADRNWKFDDEIAGLSERAKTGLRRDAIRQGILHEAASRAERSIEELLGRACQVPVVAECRQTALRLPAARD